MNPPRRRGQAIPPGRASAAPPWRRPVESQLRLAEVRYRTLVEQMPVVTFLAALDGGDNELYVSPQIESLLGFSQKEWLENPVLWYTQPAPRGPRTLAHRVCPHLRYPARFRSEYRFLAPTVE